MKKILFIAFILLNVNLFAQNSKHCLGGFAGSDTGMGFSYQYWYKKFGIQVTGVPILKRNYEHFITAGVSFLYEIKQGKHVDLYSYIGYHYIDIKHTHSIIDINGNYTTYTNVNQYHNGGLGVGFRFKLLDELSLNLQGGYGIYNFTTNNLNFNFAGGIGVYYNL